MSYLQCVADSLLPLSVADNLKDAMQEWIFTGKSEDHLKPSVACKLCTKFPIRYEYELRNQINNNEIWCGSECVKKFIIYAVADDGTTTLRGKDAQKRINSVVKERLDEARKIRASTTVNDLVRASADAPDCMQARQRHEGDESCQPSVVGNLFALLHKYGVEFRISDFPITTGSKDACEQLLCMPSYHLHLLWPLLSVRRQAICASERPYGCPIQPARMELHVRDASVQDTNMTSRVEEFNLNPSRCACRGIGWVQTDDLCIRCHFHGTDDNHPSVPIGKIDRERDVHQQFARAYKLLRNRACTRGWTSKRFDETCKSLLRGTKDASLLTANKDHMPMFLRTRLAQMYTDVAQRGLDVINEKSQPMPVPAKP